MKEIIEKSLEKTYTYQKYKDLVKELLDQGKSTGPNQSDDLLNYSLLNDKRMQRLDKTIKISEETIAKLKDVKEPQTWLVLTEGWCGDAAQNLPVINKLAEENANIQLKVVLRDENLELMDGFQVSGTANYNIRSQVVQVKSGEKTYSFNEEEIERMVFTKNDLRREFRLVALKGINRKVTLILAELIYQSTNHYSLFKRYIADTKQSLYSPYTVIDHQVDLHPDFNKDSFRFDKKNAGRQNMIRLLINYEGDISGVSRKWFLETHFDKKSELKKFIKKESISFRNDADLAKLIRYYDEISKD